MTWVEQTGTAVKVGQDDLDRIKEEMAVLGMLPLLVRPGTVTATEKAIDSADSAGEAGNATGGGQTDAGALPSCAPARLAGGP